MHSSTVLSLTRRPFQDLKWSKEDLPVFVIDGQLFRKKPPTSPVRGSYAYAIGASQSDLESLVAVSAPRTMHLRAFKGKSLAPLADVGHLQEVILDVCKNLDDLSSLRNLTMLDTLVLNSAAKVKNLSFLDGCDSLQAVGLSGGMESRKRVATLAPLANLRSMVELAIESLVSDRDGLRPLAKCPRLKRLSLPNLFETEDYAFLAAALPHVECEMLVPHTRLPFIIKGKDTMITGKGKPFLHSTEDKEQIRAYEASFDTLKARFSSELAALR